VNLADISEAAWQQQVIDLAHMLGWQHLHVRRSIGKGRKWVTATNVAWPDLTLWSEKQQRFVFAELKTEKGKVTIEQMAILNSIGRAGGEVWVWRPSDLELVKEILTKP
jgi:hypothetical protein